MNLIGGYTFFAPWPLDGGVEHLFFIISNPLLDPSQIVVVPLMTWDHYKESTCILEKGDHRFIKHRSYIDFGCAQIVLSKDIIEGLQSRKFRAHDPASAKVLSKIREGADQSEFLALGIRDILEKQGLVGPI